MTPTEIKKQLEILGVRATKLRGQHFLIDTGVLAAIAAAAELKKSDMVLEIGPGLGVLTRELLRQAGTVVAVELDLAFAKYLEASLGPQGLKLVQGDIREIDVKKELGAHVHSYKLVANIPYNITSEIFERFLMHDPAPHLLVLIVQREVALRVCATPGRMNRLAVLVQYFGEPESVRHVSRGAFWPAPKVDSTVLCIRRHADDVLRTREKKISRDRFFRMVQAGFSAPRKKLFGNLLRAGYARAALEHAFEGIGIDRNHRAEAVSMDQWFLLGRKLQSKEKKSGEHGKEV